MAFTYQVSTGPSLTGPWTAFGSPVSSLSEVITGLVPGTNYFFQVEAIDTITGLHSAPVRIGPFSTLQVTLTGISLSSSSFVAGSGLIGTINVAASGGPFIGTLALSGTNASSFQIVNGNQLQTNGILGVGTYNITITATMPNAIGSFVDCLTVGVDY